MQVENKVSIVHIFTEANSAILDIIENNSKFLKSHHVEYIIFDNLTDKNKDFLLQNISKLPSFQNKTLTYVKEELGQNTNLKQTFISSVNFATHENIFFVKDNTIINEDTVNTVEKTNPPLQKKDLEYFIKSVPENFKWEKFNLYMKKNKNILDRIKLMF